jgi:hypothetical protein
MAQNLFRYQFLLFQLCLPRLHHFLLAHQPHLLSAGLCLHFQQQFHQQML